MKTFRTHNRLLACSPFPSHVVQAIVKGGFAMADKKVTLQPLTVLAQSEPEFPVGCVVYVRADQANQPWVKEVFFREDGTPFILVPTSVVQASEVETKGDTTWNSGC